VLGGPAVVFNDNGTSFPLMGGDYHTRAKALIDRPAQGSSAGGMTLIAIASAVIGAAIAEGARIHAGDRT
jgi:hypothetical protein